MYKPTKEERAALDYARRRLRGSPYYFDKTWQVMWAPKCGGICYVVPWIYESGGLCIVDVKMYYAPLDYGMGENIICGISTTARILVIKKGSKVKVEPCRKTRPRKSSKASRA
jgi:hypothetical protein